MKSIEMIKKELGLVTAALLKKQCAIIKVDANKIDFQKPDWYQDHTWTKKQEDKFKTEFINYLYGSLKRVKEIARFARTTYRDRRKLELLWMWWDLDYGFKRSDHETEKR